MGHGSNAKEAAYMLLAERLNRNPVGTPINEELMEILHHLYTESEAMVGGKFPMAPMKLEQVASSAGIEKDELERTLQSMILASVLVVHLKKVGGYSFSKNMTKD